MTTFIEVYLFTDEGYYTATEKGYEPSSSVRREGRARSESRATKKGPIRGQGVERVEVGVGTSTPTYGYIVPVLVPWQPPRRTSPAEDFIFTMTGVRNLIDQQRMLLSELQNNLDNGKVGVVKEGVEEEAEAKDNSMETQ